MAKKDKLTINPDLRLKARSRAIASIILDLYKDRPYAQEQISKVFPVSPNKSAQSTFYSTEVKTAKALPGWYIRVNPKFAPSDKIQKRKHLNNVLFHEMTHFQMIDFNHDALANAFTSYIWATPQANKTKTVYSEREKRESQEAFSLDELWKALTNNHKNVEHGNAKGPSLSERAKILGIIAAQEEQRLGKLGIGFFIIKTAAEMKNINQAIKLAEQGRFETERIRFLNEHPLIKRMLKPIPLRVHWQARLSKEAIRFITGAFKGKRANIRELTKSPTFRPKKTRRRT